MTVRAWWDVASERDQETVLRRLRLSVGLVSVPWAFLPEEVQALLLRRLRIDPAKLELGS
jgi:hypothetical protein